MHRTFGFDSRLWAYAPLYLGALVSMFMVSACSIGALSTGDSPRPSLDFEDSVSVSPSCVVVFIGGSIGTPKSVVTVQAKRKSGGGAESVPVRFSLGNCPSWSGDLDVGSTTKIGLLDGGNSDGSVPCVNLQTSCQTEMNDSPGYLSHFALSINDASRCRSLSTTDVQCTLDPNGGTYISVEAFDIDNEVTAGDGGAAAGDGGLLGNGFAAPLCIAVREREGLRARQNTGGWFSNGNGWRYFQAGILPSSGASSERLAFNVTPIALSSACNLPAGQNCKQQIAVANVLVGVVGSNVAVSNVTDNIFETVSKDVTLNLSVRSTGTGESANPYLSSNGCNELKNGSMDAGHGSDGGAGNADFNADRDAGNALTQVTITTGQSSSSFSVCAAPYGGKFIIDASALSTISGTVTGDIPEAIEIVGTDPKDPNDNIIYAKYCGQQKRPIMSEEVNYVSAGDRLKKVTTIGPLSIDNSEICEILQVFDDGGAPGTCKGLFTLVLNDGHQCPLHK